MKSQDKFTIDLYNKNISNAYAVEKTQTSYRKKALVIFVVSTIFMLLFPNFIRFFSLGLIFAILFELFAFMLILFFWFSDLITNEKIRISHLASAYKMESVYKKILPQFLHKTLPHAKKYTAYKNIVILYIIIGSIILFELFTIIFLFLKPYIDHFSYFIFVGIPITIYLYVYLLQKQQFSLKNYLSRL